MADAVLEGCTYKTGQIKNPISRKITVARKLDRPYSHKKVEKARRWSSPMQIFHLFFCQYLERHLLELFNDISYTIIAQSLHITIHLLLRHKKLAADLFFARHQLAEFFYRGFYLFSLKYEASK